MSISFSSDEYADIDSSLSPCPFCGGKASLEFGGSADVWVECECGASGPWIPFYRGDAAATRRAASQLAADRWNQRTVTPVKEADNG